MRLSSSLIIASAMAMGLVGFGIRDAHACGGCFHPKAEAGSSVITDHRMVFKISTRETILWDQVRYSGDPKEFAWVLPVNAGARVELSHDEWIAALDATTRTTVTGPERFCGGGGGGGGRGGGGGCMGSSSSTSFEADMGSSHDLDAGFAGNGDVSVVSQSVIGPYQAVTLHANAGDGISEWLVANGFAIPDAVRPIVDAYTSARFDFIALRLRPGQGVRAMQPVRVVTPGADTTLPLRMVAAGVGSKVGLTLWVIGEGRYRTQNFPNAVVDDSLLTWDGKASRSNLTQLQSQIFASNDGRTWLTETAGHAVLSGVMGIGADPSSSLYTAYMQSCFAKPAREVPCTDGELPPPDGTPLDESADAGTSDASDAGDDGDAGDAETDAGVDGGEETPVPPNRCTKWVAGCAGYDDLDVATRGLVGDIWVTRLRADLPVQALGTDLRLEAADQTTVSGGHHTEKFSDENFDPCAGVTNSATVGSSSDGCACRTSRPLGSSVGSWLVAVVTAALASSIARRARRK
ncbi:hypothetical protein AKJ09_04922 [Labilithrix luteola]|uniref:DUF2330 domain-containing protein n=1 Tax=Labilithrix luteola TaxID=1391654 RepID=A0A0K1PXL3_9BACT|nr:DUF2330 domain-containing protein [Labilithrix luteola]AKU98258.1 hypothetical protein AKJ09_04922 [Labilithrix luteola]